MAKSKNGGSRAFIRGRIGSDVYSVGKDGQGKRQQVVRSLAVQVTNPRTSAQMFNRMVMSTIMQAVSALSEVIDHSFDGVAKGQPSISEFIRRNYALAKADAIAHPMSGQSFGMNLYQEKGVKAGHYIVSNGSASLPSAVKAVSYSMQISLPTGNITVGGLKSALGTVKDGYLTYVGLPNTSDVISIFRVRLDTSLSDATAITSGNVASLFAVEANTPIDVVLNEGKILIYNSSEDGGDACGVIASVPENGGWIHSTCVLDGDGLYSWPSDYALASYPVGSEQFLNGGDL